MWKEWMLVFRWDVTGNDERFFFSTKEEMIKFVKDNGVRVSAMFHLEKVTE